MKEYHFSGELATKYGLDEAIMLHHLAYWVQKNTIDGRNIHGGRSWTYNSQNAFAAWFDWWSRRQIQRILKSLEDQGAIIKGSFNARPMDHTLWYTVSDAVLAHYAIALPHAGLETMELDEPAEKEAKTVQSFDPNGAIEGTGPVNEKHETVPAIPKNKHKEKPKSNTLSDRGSDGAGVNQDAQFTAFWERYPRKEGKKKAREKWMRLNPDPALYARIMAGLERHKRSEQWRRGVIPHPTTWLNGERWEDELTPNGRGPAPDTAQRIDPGEGYEYV